MSFFLQILLFKERIEKILEATNKKSYLKWYIKAGTTEKLRWRDVQILKFVPDLWNYLEIIQQHKIINVIEFGSFRGGSTIFFADMLKLFETGGKVLAVDIEDRMDPKTNRPDIEKLTASSISDMCEQTVKKFRLENPGKVLVILDSEHTSEHIYNELKLITPILVKDDYLVLEDAGYETSMLPGMKKFFDEHSMEYDHDIEREELFGVTPAKYGYWIKK